MSELIRVKFDTDDDATPWEIADGAFLVLRGLKESILATAKADGIEVGPEAIVPCPEMFTADTPNERAAMELLALRLKTEPL